MINIDELLATPGSLTQGRTYEQVLREARALIQDPECWTQEAYARDASRNHVKPRDPKACCWCMLGAVARCSNPHGIIPPPLMNYLTEMVTYCFGGAKFAGPGSMNDYVSHEVILNFLDTALEQFPKESP